MAIIKNPIVIIRTQEGGFDVQQTILTENTCRIEITEIGTSRDTVSMTNIESYKAQDLAYILQNGGTLATETEYAAAELELQKIYTSIMLGGEING